MTLLQLNLEALLNPAILMDCPYKNQNKLQKIQKTLGQWTDPQHTDKSIYSGYRRQILSREGLGPSKLLAQSLREQFKTMVVLGIGGSALGSKTAYSALQWSVAEADRRTLHVAENLDPLDFDFMWSQLDLSSTCFAVVTKSGSTIETLAQLSVVLDRLESAGLEASKHIVAITDPEKGALRSWVHSQNIPSLEVPPDVGGRFSVLSPVGLLPLAFAGIDIDALVEGAIRQFQGAYFQAETLAQLAIRLGELEQGGWIGHVLLPYSTVLRDFGDWFVQLWGESLGKKKAHGSSVGSIPVAGVGATDQHSLLQLLVEGPNQMVNAFIHVKNWPSIGVKAPTMKKLPVEFAALSYAYGKTFGDILNCEAQATYKVLSEQVKRPCYGIELETLNAEAVGALFAFYMDLTVLTAAYHEVNPFDQPGVEYGKKILPELLIH